MELRTVILSPFVWCSQSAPSPACSPHAGAGGEKALTSIASSRLFSTPPRLSSRCENRVVLVRKSVHCGRTGRQTALVTKSFQLPEPSRSNSIPQWMQRLKYVHAPWHQEESADAFHRSGRRKAQGRPNARTYIRRHRKQ